MKVLYVPLCSLFFSLAIVTPSSSMGGNRSETFGYDSQAVVQNIQAQIPAPQVVYYVPVFQCSPAGHSNLSANGTSRTSERQALFLICSFIAIPIMSIFTIYMVGLFMNAAQETKRKSSRQANQQGNS